MSANYDPNPLSPIINIPTELSATDISHINIFITSLHVVAFDLIEGSSIEYTWPNVQSQIHCNDEYTAISGSSLPDSNTNDNSNDITSTHIFRIRRVTKNTSHLFGYVYYCQRSDSNNARGYMQKSVVLVSHLPYVDFFIHCINIIGTRYFGNDSNDINVLCNALNDMKQWPAPDDITDNVLLHLLDSTLQYNVPSLSNNNLKVYAPSSQLFSAHNTPLHSSASTPTHLNSTTQCNDMNNVDYSKPIEILPDVPATDAIPGSPRITRIKNPTSIHTSRIINRMDEPDSAPVIRKVNTRELPLDTKHITHGEPKSPPPAVIFSAPTSPANSTFQSNSSTPSTPRNAELHSYYTSMTANKILNWGKPAGLSTTQKPLSIRTRSVNPVSSSTLFSSIHLYTTYQSMLPNLWCLYELILCNDPILILGSTPHTCSNAVLSAISLISPLVYNGDYRPYFTLYDIDFKHYRTTLNKSSQTAAPNVVLGCTNSLFARTMTRIPHIVLLNGTQAIQSEMSNDYNITKSIDNISDNTINKQSILVTPHTPTFQPDTSILRRLLSAKPLNQSNHTKIRSNSVKPSQSLAQLPAARTSYDQVQLTRGSSDFTSGKLSSQSNELVGPDQQVMNSINDAVLRNYFKTLTLQILQPFNIYFTLSNQQIDTINTSSFNPYLHTITLPKFDNTTFLTDIQALPIELVDKLPLQSTTLKSSRRSAVYNLYDRFIQSTNFTSWYIEQRATAERQLQKLIDNVILKLYAQPRASAFTRFLDAQRVQHTRQMYKNASNMHTMSITKNNAQLTHAIAHHMNLIQQCAPQQHASELNNTHI